MVRLVHMLYKTLSGVLLASGLYAFFQPTEAMGFIFRTPPVVHVLPIFLVKMLALAMVMLSACVCTATTNASSSKSTGAGLAFAGLLLLLATTTQDLPAILNPIPLFGLSLTLSVLGLAGFYAAPPSDGVAQARVEDEGAGKGSRTWQSYSKRRNAAPKVE